MSDQKHYRDISVKRFSGFMGSVTIRFQDGSHPCKSKRKAMNKQDGKSFFEKTPRQNWMAILAKARTDELLGAWKCLPHIPTYGLVRRPEVGLIMVQARVGGSGRRFILGEMTITRCVVALDSGLTGYSFIAGRDERHAEVAAVLDAMLQDTACESSVRKTVLEPLEQSQRRQKESDSAHAAATKVDFFTMVRGED